MVNAVPDEFATNIEEIDTKYRNITEALEQEIEELRRSIKTLALESGHTKVETIKYQIFLKKYPPKWNSPGLLGYAVAKPEILAFIDKPARAIVAIKRRA